MENKYLINIVVAVMRDGQLALELVNSKDKSYVLPSFPLDASQQPETMIDEYIQAHFGAGGAQKELLAFCSDVDSGRALNLVFKVDLSGLEVVLSEGAGEDFRIVWQNVPSKKQAKKILKDALSLESLGLLLGWEASDAVSMLKDKTFFVYADGASRGNPGHSAAAYVIYDVYGNAIVKNGEYLGITTSTVAEYQAVKIALEAVESMGAKVVEYRGDSLSTINQLNKIYTKRTNLNCLASSKICW